MIVEQKLDGFNAFKVSDNPNDQLLIINMIEDVKTEEVAIIYYLK